MRIADYFDATAKRLPCHEVFVDDTQRLDYQTAQRFVHAVAHGLMREPDLGVGGHVGVYSPNTATVSMLQLGINRADCVWVLVHTRNTAEANAKVLAYADTRLIFFHSAFEPAVQVMRRALPAEVKWVCIDRASEIGPQLGEWLEGCWRPFPAQREDPMAPAYIAPTGGTTGPNKAVLQTHRSAEIGVFLVSSTLGMTAASRHLVIAPLTHAAGIFALSLVLNGGANVILPGFDLERVLAIIETEHITHVYLPATAVYALLGHPATRKTDLTSLQCVLVGGSPIAPSRFKEALDVFGPVLYEMYGQTESMMITLKRPGDYDRGDGSIDEEVVRATGRVAPFVRIEIMDEKGQILVDGQPGEIVILSSMTMQTYYKMPAETEEVSRFGWHHTGDVGVRDGRGYITIIDRLRDVIISGGLNIYPSEIEDVINELPDVLDCSVVGVPDEKWGERVMAVVQMKPGRTISEEVLIAHCEPRLGSLKMPRAVQFWDDLPRSPVGKTLKREIRKKFWDDQWRAV